MDIMAMAEQAKLPPDILAVGNSRIILSKSGSAFLVDAGFKDTLPELKRMASEGRVKGVDGVWITHYHDDHTDYVNEIASAFGSRVFFTDTMSEVLQIPPGFGCRSDDAARVRFSMPLRMVRRWSGTSGS